MMINPASSSRAAARLLLLLLAFPQVVTSLSAIAPRDNKVLVLVEPSPLTYGA